MTMTSAALESGLILFREGLEALLVISALAAFLNRAGLGTRVRHLYVGVALAVLASIAAAVAFEVFLGGAHDDRMEAIVMVVAALLMFYMSGWLFLKQDPRAWQATLRALADHAVSAGTTLSLVLIAFLAVFREGAETVLFLHAGATAADGWSYGFWAGLAGATACLALIWIAIDAFAARLPLRAIFLATSAFLFWMGLKFIGGAVKELQEMQLLAYDEMDLPAMIANSGINPTWEAIIPQLFIVGIAFGAVIYAFVRRRDASPAKIN
ncbi:MAG: FTR1 family protein [Notoacmeibacter sp.]|nr:FTR1 family protein [Notoacmeibacter sp.]MCC0033176.1 FTR1 family protein [Brucellaceae bacterium]